METKFRDALHLRLSAPTDAEFRSCGLYTEDDFDDYWYELLSPEKAEAVANHCLECTHCLSGISWVKVIHDKGAQLAEKIDTQRLIEAARNEMRKIDREQALQYQWAAASESEGLIGQAFGVVVAMEKEIGALTQCNAFVDNKEKTKGKFEIWGRQIEGFDNGYLVEKPLDYLEERLSKGLFRGCTALRYYNLDHRNINVDLKERAISHASSLSLAIIMAIVNALHRRNDPHFVYSADLRQDGVLQGVGAVEIKIDTAIQEGMRHIVLAQANKKDVPQRYFNHPDIELHFFNTLADVLAYLGLEPSACIDNKARTRDHQQDGKESQKNMWANIRPPEEPHELELFDAMDLLQIEPSDHSLRNRLFSFFEDLCQTGEIRDELSTLFLMGDPERISRIFPDLFMKFESPIHLFNAAAIIEPLAGMVNGQELCFVVTPDGELDSIRRIAIKEFPIIGAHSMLPNDYSKLAMLSAAVDAVIFYFPPLQSQIQFFAKGVLVAKYGNGRWRLTDYEKLSLKLMEIAEKKDIHWPTLAASLCAAIALADSGHGGTFAFISENAIEGASWRNGLMHEFGLYLEKPARHPLTDKLLIALAHLKGAVIMDLHGRLVVCNALFESNNKTCHNQMTGMRHRVAQAFSESANALVIVASRYGAISIYENGEEILQM